MFKKGNIYSILMLLLVFTGPIVFSQDNQKSTSVTIKNQPIPIAGFKNRDIGNPAIKGIVKVSNNGFDITTGDVDIWGCCYFSQSEQTRICKV